MSSSSLIKRVVDGEKQILCHKCKTFRYLHEYSPNEKFMVQICSDCYADDYKEELQDYFELCKLVEMTDQFTEEDLIKVLGEDDYKKFKYLVKKYEL